MESDGACFSTSQTSLDLRNRLRAREPSHPLLRLFNPPELSDAERASLEWEVQRGNEKCKTKKGCRPPYCIPDGGACMNMSKRVEELRGLLAPVPAGARQASQPSAAPSSSEAQQQRPRRRLSVKTSRKAWEEGTGAASTASAGRGAVSQVSQPSSESAQRSPQSDMPDQRQRLPPPSAPRPNVEAQAVKREASASTTGGDSPPPVADPSRALATPYDNRPRTSYLGDRSLPWFSLLPDISQDEEPTDPRTQEYLIPPELSGEDLEEEVDQLWLEDFANKLPRKSRKEYKADIANRRAELRAALDKWIKEYDEVLMPAYRNRKANQRLLPVDGEPPLVEPPAFARMSDAEQQRLLRRGKTSRDIDAIEEERLKQYLEDYARYAERKQGGARPTAKRSSARPALATREG